MPHWINMFLLAGSIAGAANMVRGAEIRLREVAQANGALVHLGDVADVLTNDPDEAQTLQEIELFPAPSGAAKRYLKVRELQDLLAERRVNFLKHRLSGASQVEISVARTAPAAPQQTLAGSTVQRATDVVRLAVARHLQTTANTQAVYDVNVTLDEETARRIAVSQFRVGVQGGEAPWTGRQRFAVVLASAAEPLPLEVDVRQTPTVVVAARPLPRGTIVQLPDVALQPLKIGQPLGDAFQSIEQVVGRETAQGMVSGQIVNRPAIRSPVLVRKGDAVTIMARSNGLRVRTTARAREDGGHGDLIAVESLLNRQAFFVRVTGIQEAEVYARAIDAQGEKSAGAGASEIFTQGVR